MPDQVDYVCSEADTSFLSLRSTWRNQDTYNKMKEVCADDTNRGPLWIFSASLTNRTWKEAMKYCHEKDMELPVPTNELENELINRQEYGFSFYLGINYHPEFSKKECFLIL